MLLRRSQGYYKLQVTLIITTKLLGVLLVSSTSQIVILSLFVNASAVFLSRKIGPIWALRRGTRRRSRAASGAASGAASQVSWQDKP